MSKRIISVNLSQRSIDKAIKAVKKYKQDLLAKNAEFIDRLKDYGIEIVNAQMQDIPNPTGSNSMNIGTDEWDFRTSDSESSSSGKIATAMINVSGNRLLYVEFGYGINAKDNPHPTGKYGAGTNPVGGQGLSEKGWWYTGTDGKSYHTWGDSAYAPVWKTAEHIRNHKEVILEIAKEVFGSG